MSEIIKMSEEKQGEEKQGKKCCGFCCDFRRAVIVMAILGIIEFTILIIVQVFGIAFGASIVAEAEDDDLVQASGIGIAVTSGLIAGLYAIGLLFSIFHLLAALKYSVCMLATVLVFNFIGLGYDIYYATLVGGDLMIGLICYCIVVAAIYIYPTVGLLMEIKEGIMSPETYPREAYSCCCKPKV